MLSYTLDREDRIVAVDRGWDHFADQNGAPELFASEIIGRSLWEFIHDQPTVQLYRSLHQRLRDQRRGIAFDFRCDSPDQLRSLRMAIDHRDDGILVVRTESVLCEPRAGRLRPIYACTRVLPSVPRCSLCGRLGMEERWLAVEAALEEGLSLAPGAVFNVHYGICPDCRSDLDQRMASLRPVA